MVLTLMVNFVEWRYTNFVLYCIVLYCIEAGVDNPANEYNQLPSVIWHCWLVVQKSM